MADAKKVKCNGALFKKEEQSNKKAPVYSGVINVTKEFARELVERVKKAGDDEVKLQLSGWVKKDKNDNTYISISVDFGQPKQDKKSAVKDPFDDEIPF